MPRAFPTKLHLRAEMPYLPSNPLRVLMVTTREIPPQAESGRERTMVFIRDALGSCGEVRIFHLRSVLEQKSIRRLTAVVFSAVSSLLRGRLLPLQALLFENPQAVRAIKEIVTDWQPDCLYLDGVRSGVHAESLRRAFPTLRIVCDFDDLMSRRMEILAEAGQPISAGYLKKSVPVWVQTHILNGFVARWVLAFERRALSQLEARILKVCQQVVLVSDVDAQHLLQRLPHAPVTVIPPSTQVRRAFKGLLRIERFIFIGTDTLLQNRLTIECLHALWQRLAPATELHIFGKQAGSYQAVPGVVFRGFIDDLAAAYGEHCVLLAPSFIAGGVKTKVLEAMSYGVVPVGTEITFEGIQSDCTRLTLSLTELEHLVLHPQHWLNRLGDAGEVAISGAVTHHHHKTLSQCWCQVIWPTSWLADSHAASPPPSQKA